MKYLSVIPFLIIIFFSSCQEEQNNIEFFFIENTTKEAIQWKINRKLNAIKEVDRKEQIRIYKEILELDSLNLKAVWGLIDLYKTNYKEHDSALVLLYKVQELQSENALVFLEKGILFSWKYKDLDSALKNFDRGISINPKVSRMYFEKAKVLQKLEKYDEAKATWKKCALTDYNGTAYYYLAKLYESLNQKDSACIYLDSAYVYKERNQLYWFKMKEMNKNLNCGNKTKLENDLIYGK